MVTRREIIKITHQFTSNAFLFPDYSNYLDNLISIFNTWTFLLDFIGFYDNFDIFVFFSEFFLIFWSEMRFYLFSGRLDYFGHLHFVLFDWISLDFPLFARFFEDFKCFKLIFVFFLNSIENNRGEMPLSSWGFCLNPWAQKRILSFFLYELREGNSNSKKPRGKLSMEFERGK